MRVTFDSADLRGAHLLEGILGSNSYQGAIIDETTVVLRPGVQQEKNANAKYAPFANQQLESHKPLSVEEMKKLAEKHGMLFVES